MVAQSKIHSAASEERDATNWADVPLPLVINISPILKSVAGKLTDDEIDQWLVGLAKANEGRGFYAELTGEGELVINAMVNRDGGHAEGQLFGTLFVWVETHDGETHPSRTIVRLPDGSRTEPDAVWLSPEQVAELPPLSDGGAITVCPAFVAEIMSSTDRLPPLQRKMELYMANGSRMGWLIDPYRRRVYVYFPGVAPLELTDPEVITGDPVLPGFVFEVRRRIFDIHQTAQQ
ncbi:MAG: Uma2 family endonuclease [Chloroflexota bacterium]|nr:Uma2 family endonuclease [Chloroflexota bacterium]MDE2959572.1 Uma2 family endonuclease [Chloroflexota bacterium]